MSAPGSAAAKVAVSYDGAAPDWVLALAALVDQSNQGRAAKAIGYSNAVVSTVLINNYAGDLAKVERAVRGALLDLTVDCPVVGELGANTCLSHQRRPLIPTNPQRVLLYRACRAGCPHSFLEKRHAVG